MLRTALASLAALMTALSADAEQDLAITIYNDDVALVRDVRTIPFEPGRAVVEFENVSAAIVPQTVSLVADDVTVIEQNFDYDLLSPAKLMEKAVGERVRIVRTNPGNGAETSEIAQVLSVNDGAVLRIGERIEVLRDDGLPTRVIFDEVPPNLRARPTLSVDLQTQRADERAAELRYLTHGLSWSADYVGVFDEKAELLDFQGWITLTNQSGTTFPAARTRLVAGNVNLGRGIGQPRAEHAPQRAGTESAPQQTLADYYLYELPQRTTLADRQTKQVGFADASGVPAKKVYRYVADWFRSASEPDGVVIAIEFENSRAARLGIPLPAGVVRMYARDSQEKAQFIGEDQLEHSPAGSRMAFDIGEAFDVTVQPEVVEQSSGSMFRDGFVRMKYVFRNARKTPARVVFEQGSLYYDWELEEASQPGAKRDAFTLQWLVDVPPNGEKTLTFRIDWD